MKAYKIKGIYPSYSTTEQFRSVLAIDGTNADIKELAEGDGWFVKSVSVANADDLDEFPDYDDLLAELQEAIKDKKREAAVAIANLSIGESASDFVQASPETNTHSFENREEADEDREPLLHSRDDQICQAADSAQGPADNRGFSLPLLLLVECILVVVGIFGSGDSKFEGTLKNSAGQFIIGRHLISAIDGNVSLGIALLFAGLTVIFFSHGKRLRSDCNFVLFLLYVGVAGVLGATTTLAMQNIALDVANEKLAHAVRRWQYLVFPHHFYELRNSAVILLGNLVVVVGAGYAFTNVVLPIGWHMLIYFASVALVEECSKFLIAFLVYKIALRNRQIDRENRKRWTLWSFLVAGLGFGSAEAILYFWYYNAVGAGSSIYAVRALWCVLLHGSFAVVTGTLVACGEFFDLQRKKSANWNETQAHFAGVILSVIIVCSPAMGLHALYDAFALHDNQLMWVVGLVTICAALKSVGDFAEPQRGQMRATRKRS